MLLLDSQVVLWTIAGSRRLGRRARERIQTAAVVHVSAATVWELQIKAMLGKVGLPDDLLAKLRDQGFAELAVTAEDAVGIGQFPEIVKHDPFDRLLVAQAGRAGLDLLTADRILLGLGRDFIVDATI